MSGVRRTTAHRLTQAWNTVPHVFQHDRADITGVEALRKRLSKKSEAEGRAPITITAFLMKMLAAALKKFPQMNSSVDMQTDEIIYKQYVHIGVAVDTDRGLLVPVIRDVDQKDIFQIADDIAQAAEKAQEPQAVARRHAGRVDHHLEPGQPRRRRVHADRQLARSGDPRRRARAHGAGVHRRRVRRRGS